MTVFCMVNQIDVCVDRANQFCLLMFVYCIWLHTLLVCNCGLTN